MRIESMNENREDDHARGRQLQLPWSATFVHENASPMIRCESQSTVGISMYKYLLEGILVLVGVDLWSDSDRCNAPNLDDAR